MQKTEDRGRFSVLYSYTIEYTDQKSHSVAIQAHTQMIGVVHTHPYGSNIGTTRFSPQDYNAAIKLNLLIYVYGPDGKMRKFDPVSMEDIVIFDDLPHSMIRWWEE